MHRACAIGRALGRSCRKWRENECPAVGGEEVRKGGNKKNEEFVPDAKYNITDAIGWTAGLVLAYEFTHRRGRSFVIEERPTSTCFQKFKNIGDVAKCPFGWPKQAITQPILSQSVSVVEVKQSTRGIAQKTSIDLTPFIKEEGLVESDFGRSKCPEDDDDLVQFTNEVQTSEVHKPQTSLRYSTALNTKLSKADDDLNKLSLAGKLTGDLLSVLGAFKFMNNQRSSATKDEIASWMICPTNSLEEPPLTAMELMERGADLGSARALYNIGVAYDRMNEAKLARDYYRKASDLGHPLATYNSAVFLLRDGRIGDGLVMMRVAAESGVPEAKKILSSRSP